MKQHHSSLRRLSGLVIKKEEKNKIKQNFFSPLTSRFLHQIITSYSQAKQKNLLAHLLSMHRHH
jgi:hypothetical protein